MPMVGALSLREIFQQAQLWAATWGHEVAEVLPAFKKRYLTDGAARILAGYQHYAAAPNPAQDQGNYVGSIAVHLLILAQPSPTPFSKFFHADTVQILLREQRGAPPPAGALPTTAQTYWRPLSSTSTWLRTASILLRSSRACKSFCCASSSTAACTKDSRGTHPTQWRRERSLPLLVPPRYGRLPLSSTTSLCISRSRRRGLAARGQSCKAR